MRGWVRSWGRTWGLGALHPRSARRSTGRAWLPCRLQGREGGSGGAGRRSALGRRGLPPPLRLRLLGPGRRSSAPLPGRGSALGCPAWPELGAAASERWGRSHRPGPAPAPAPLRPRPPPQVGPGRAPRPAPASAPLPRAGPGRWRRRRRPRRALGAPGGSPRAALRAPEPCGKGERGWVRGRAAPQPCGCGGAGEQRPVPPRFPPKPGVRAPEAARPCLAARLCSAGCPSQMSARLPGLCHSHPLRDGEMEPGAVPLVPGRGSAAWLWGWVRFLKEG